MDTSAGPAAGQAAVVLAAYVAGFTLVVVTVFRRRAIT